MMPMGKDFIANLQRAADEIIAESRRAEPQERGALRDEIALEVMKAQGVLIPTASGADVFAMNEAAYSAADRILALRDAAPSEPEPSGAKSCGCSVYANCFNHTLDDHQIARVPAAERTQEETERLAERIEEWLETPTEGGRSIHHYEMEMREACDLLVEAAAALRSQVAQPSGETSLTGGPLISEKRGPSPLAPRAPTRESVAYEVWAGMVYPSMRDNPMTRAIWADVTASWRTNLDISVGLAFETADRLLSLYAAPTERSE